MRSPVGRSEAFYSCRLAAYRRLRHTWPALERAVRYRFSFHCRPAPPWPPNRIHRAWQTPTSAPLQCLCSLCLLEVHPKCPAEDWRISPGRSTHDESHNALENYSSSFAPPPFPTYCHRARIRVHPRWPALDETPNPRPTPLSHNANASASGRTHFTRANAAPFASWAGHSEGPRAPQQNPPLPDPSMHPFRASSSHRHRASGRDMDHTCSHPTNIP